jgi:FAD/FMN-containing dehydrogenase
VPSFGLGEFLVQAREALPVGGPGLPVEDVVGSGTGASYLNFTHEADRVRDAHGHATYARLVALKDTYDPANLFRLNQNIRPSQPAVEPMLA